MSETVVDPDIGSALARLHCAVDDLMTLPVDALTDDDLLALSRGVETERRRLPVVDHRLIGAMGDPRPGLRPRGEDDGRLPQAIPAHHRR